jgi:uncharacterized LabA/DUF88 family protein
MSTARANIYVDGFNLYYGAVKDTPYKWLNIAELCRLVLPSYYHINEIKYFTARVKSRPPDLNQHVRQQMYFRALKTLPNLTIIEGHFLTKKCMMPLVNPISGKRFVEVIKTEEKGSDVNLATHLLFDAVKKDYDIGIMITNDSDLLEPIKIVRTELGLQVGIINPQKKPSVVLQKYASFIASIRSGVLAASQFPDEMTDSVGTFRKPAVW